MLHAPLTPETHHLIDDSIHRRAATLTLLVNVSRGGVVDNNALVRGLDEGRIRAQDWMSIEGEPAPPKFVTGAKDVIATPHVAFASDASLAELRQRSAEEVVRVLRGERPLHPCNQPSLGGGS